MAAPYDLDPQQFADKLASEHDQVWVDAVIERLLDTGRADELRFVQDVLRLSDTDVAAIFGVARQAVAQWRLHGVPVRRLDDVAALASAARVLRRRVVPSRIPAVVRRPAGNLGGRTLLALAAEEGTQAMFDEVRDTVDLRRVAP